jgi:hypothetical protein
MGRSCSTDGKHEIGTDVAVEWLALLLHIVEVQGSNRGTETGCLELYRDFCVSSAECWNSTLRRSG